MVTILARLYWLAAAALLPVVAVASGVWLPGAGNLNVDVRNLQERRFDHVVRQQYDFSCGSAALATLLTFHYNEPTTERETFDYMYARGDKAKIAKVGFSLLDMKAFLAENGYQADGYEASLDTLAGAGVSAIALINYRGYQHFVVVKGLKDGMVLIADPSLGTRLAPRAEFEAMWPSRILFIIKNRSTVGKQYFNTAAEWSSASQSPLDDAVSRDSLGGLTINLPTAMPNGLSDL